jgi:hypothetical protein
MILQWKTDWKVICPLVFGERGKLFQTHSDKFSNFSRIRFPRQHFSIIHNRANLSRFGRLIFLKIFDSGCRLRWFCMSFLTVGEVTIIYSNDSLKRRSQNQVVRMIFVSNSYLKLSNFYRKFSFHSSANSIVGLPSV